jgi:hypothetical protein
VHAREELALREEPWLVVGTAFLGASRLVVVDVHPRQAAEPVVVLLRRNPSTAAPEGCFEIVDHVVDGDTIATRVIWTGTPALDAPPFRAGAPIRADSFMHFTLRDGRVAHQENYDCFHPQSDAERGRR